MNRLIAVAVVFIAAGILSLAYDRFTYTEDAEKAKLGPIELTVKEKHTIDIPEWAGISAIAAGAAVLAVGLTKGK